jgi:DNA helicase II / ATP-dependent DNA helicase PcrA
MAWDDNLDRQSPAHGIASAAERFVRVVAGPGTGKSFALKRRVARLLEERQTFSKVLHRSFAICEVTAMRRQDP